MLKSGVLEESLKDDKGSRHECIVASQYVLVGKKLLKSEDLRTQPARCILSKGLTPTGIALCKCEPAATLANGVVESLQVRSS